MVAYAAERPAFDALAHMLEAHVAVTLEAAGLSEHAAQVRALAHDPSTILGTVEPEPREPALYVVLHRGVR